MHYRIRQFFKSITSKLTEADETFIQKYLNEYETETFYLLSKSEQVHSVSVAKGVLDELLKLNRYDVLIVKAALLHDVGKINSGLNPFNKSLYVILNKISPNILSKFTFFRSVNVFYNHPQLAAKYLKGEDDYMMFLIMNHHNYEQKNDDILMLMQKIDSEN